MIQLRTFFLALGALVLVAAPTLQARSGDVATDIFTTAVGTGIGSTIGTALGNAISSGSSSRTYHRRPVKEVVVEKVHYVPTTTRYVRHMNKLERTQARLQAELDELLSQKKSLERRLRALEQELNDTENAIEIHKESLRSIEMKKKDLDTCEQPRAGREVAEIEVR